MNVPHASQHTVDVHNQTDVLYRSTIYMNTISKDRLPTNYYVAGPTCHQNPFVKAAQRRPPLHATFITRFWRVEELDPWRMSPVSSGEVKTITCGKCISTIFDVLYST